MENINCTHSHRSKYTQANDFLLTKSLSIFVTDFVFSNIFMFAILLSVCVYNVLLLLVCGVVLC